MLGARDNKRACDAAKQLYLVVTVISLAISALIMAFREPLLRLLFGTITDSVMQSALTYLTVSVFSYPVLAIYNAGAALFRAQGNSRVSMLIASLINIVNPIGNRSRSSAWAGALPVRRPRLLISRGMAAVVITIPLLNPEHTVSCAAAAAPPGWRTDRTHFTDRRAERTKIFVSAGCVLVVSMIALFGTTQITANALANNLMPWWSFRGRR
ncbi:MAG: MATE family efflux transporter [Butyricicoccaceae bacterium]